MNTKIRWSNKERTDLLLEVKRQHEKHPTMRTLDLVRMAQKIALPSSRRRELTGTQQVEWIDEERDKWITAEKNYVPVAERPIFVEELPPPPPKQDWKELLVEFLSDAMVHVVVEAIARAREKLDLPIAAKEPPKKDRLKRVAIYGLLPAQAKHIYGTFKGCYEFRFLTSAAKNISLKSAADWADEFIIMTKFVSHDYDVIARRSNVRFNNGAASALITELERQYLEGKP